MYYLNGNKNYTTRKELLDSELEKVILDESLADEEWQDSHQSLERRKRFLCSEDRLNYETWFYEDSFGAPIGKDENGVDIYKIASIAKIPDHCFKRPEYSILLPPVSREIAKFAHSRVKSVLLKKNIIERNLKHTEIKSDKYILDNAVYHADTILRDKPQEKPLYYVTTRDDTKGYFTMVTLDFSKNNFIEIVDWRYINAKKYDEMVNMSIKSDGGEFHYIATE